MTNLAPQLLQSIDEGKITASRLLWSVYTSFLADHWVAIVIFLAAIFSIALVKAFSGYWAMLGRVLYNSLYFGTLFIIGLIKGPEVFVSWYFEMFCVILLYPVCYFLVGRILDFSGVMRRTNY